MILGRQGAITASRPKRVFSWAATRLPYARYTSTPPATDWWGGGSPTLVSRPQQAQWIQFTVWPSAMVVCYALHHLPTAGARRGI